MVPVLFAGKPDSSIFAWTDSIRDMGAESPQVGLLKYSFPIGRFTATAWDTAYVTSLDMTEEDNTWPVLLEGAVTVDDGDPRSLTVVTDPETGRIRAILRDWDGALPAALGDTEGLEVVTTRGIAEAVRLR